MQSRLLKVLQGTSAALLASSAAAAIAPPGEPWELVPAEELARYRGGMDLGSLVANFAIQRVVEVDGVVVARMQIVISNLDNLGNGGAPTVTVSGPVAELVQIMNTEGVAAAARAAQTLGQSGEPAGLASDNSPALTSARSGSGLITNDHDSPGSVAAGSNGGSISGTGSQSGSSAQFGNAVSTAVSAANGALSSLAPSSTGSTSSGSTSGASASNASTSAAAPSAANPISAVTASVNGAAAAAVPSVAQSTPSGNGVVAPGTPIVVLPVSNDAATGTSASLVTSKTIALGNTGQVAILSDLPNATAITTAVQNEVRAATIQTQTTISATLSSLSSLNALNLANQIRQQVAGGP